MAAVTRTATAQLSRSVPPSMGLPVCVCLARVLFLFSSLSLHSHSPSVTSAAVVVCRHAAPRVTVTERDTSSLWPRLSAHVCVEPPTEHDRFRELVLWNPEAPSCTPILHSPCRSGAFRDTLLCPRPCPSLAAFPNFDVPTSAHANPSRPHHHASHTDTQAQIQVHNIRPHRAGDRLHLQRQSPHDVAQTTQELDFADGSYTKPTSCVSSVRRCRCRHHRSHTTPIYGRRGLLRKSVTNDTTGRYIQIAYRRRRMHAVTPTRVGLPHYLRHPTPGSELMVSLESCIGRSSN